MCPAQGLGWGLYFSVASSSVLGNPWSSWYQWVQDKDVTAEEGPRLPGNMPFLWWVPLGPLMGLAPTAGSTSITVCTEFMFQSLCPALAGALPCSPLKPQLLAKSTGFGGEAGMKREARTECGRYQEGERLKKDKRTSLVARW